MRVEHLALCWRPSLSGRELEGQLRGPAAAVRDRISRLDGEVLATDRLADRLLGLIRPHQRRGGAASGSRCTGSFQKTSFEIERPSSTTGEGPNCYQVTDSQDRWPRRDQQ